VCGRMGGGSQTFAVGWRKGGWPHRPERWSLGAAANWESCESEVANSGPGEWNPETEPPDFVTAVNK
jgi:hypothetical protein